MERAAEVLPAGQVVMTASPYEAARDADALLILTDWEEFSALELDRIAGALRYPIVIDGRNLYGREQMARHGLTYMSVGRPDVTPQPRLAAADRKAA